MERRKIFFFRSTYFSEVCLNNKLGCSFLCKKVLSFKSFLHLKENIMEKEVTPTQSWGAITTKIKKQRHLNYKSWNQEVSFHCSTSLFYLGNTTKLKCLRGWFPQFHVKGDQNCWFVFFAKFFLVKMNS